MSAMFGRRILILVPHPDDEVVACAAAIGRARADGAKLFALYLTDGCIAAETQWPWRRGRRHADDVARRRREAEGVAERLGVEPVAWMTRPTRSLWRGLPEVCEEIASAIADRGADQIWVPAYEGGNPDHDGLNALASLFAPEISALEFAEYNFFGRRTRAQEFPFLNGEEQTLALSEDERAFKRALLASYVSEQANLGYVGVERECFRPLASYDYSRPPHPGVLWYARFQWTPFRHPRVDFTPPMEVSQTICAFLASRGGRARGARET